MTSPWIEALERAEAMIDAKDIEIRQLQGEIEFLKREVELLRRQLERANDPTWNSCGTARLERGYGE